MTPFIRRLIALVVCGLGLGSTLSAQTPAPPPRPAALRFLFLEDKPAAYFIQTGRGEYQQISSSPYAISTPFTPPTVEPVPIYRYQVQPPNPATPGVTPSPYVKVGSVTPSVTTTSTLIVFAPQSPVAPATVPGLRAVEYNTDPTEFPAGSVRVINLGRAAMGVKLGGAGVVQITPGATEVLHPTPDEKNRVPARIAVQEGGGWRVLSNKILMLRPNQRITGVFVYSPSGMRHTYTREELAEFGPPKPGHAWLTFTDTPPPPPVAP